MLADIKPAKVISGMALGWDQALARAAVDLAIPFDAYVPFLGQESVWPPASQAEYKDLMGKAELIVYTGPPGYSAYKMQIRNCAMVDNSDAMLALWNGSGGGTRNCVKFAEEKGKPVINVWDRWVK